ncbi:MAG: hypothetical protein VW378_06185 [bacterium]
MKNSKKVYNHPTMLFKLKPQNILIISGQTLSTFIHSLFLLSPLSLGFPKTTFHILFQHPLKTENLPPKLTITNNTSHTIIKINEKKVITKSQHELHIHKNCDSLKFNTPAIIIDCRIFEKHPLSILKTNTSIGFKTVKDLPYTKKIPLPKNYKTAPLENTLLTLLQPLQLHINNKQKFLASSCKHSNKIETITYNDIIPWDTITKRLQECQKLISNHPDIISLYKSLGKTPTFLPPLSPNIDTILPEKNILILQENQQQETTKQTLLKQNYSITLIGFKKQTYKYLLKNNWHMTTLSPKNKAKKHSIIIFKNTIKNKLYKILYTYQFKKQKRRHPVILWANNHFDLLLQLKGIC